MSDLTSGFDDSTTTTDISFLEIDEMIIDSENLDDAANDSENSDDSKINSDNKSDAHSDIERDNVDEVFLDARRRLEIRIEQKKLERDIKEFDFDL